VEHARKPIGPIVVVTHRFALDDDLVSVFVPVDLTMLQRTA